MGLGGGEVYDGRGRVAAEQRALRAEQHLYALEIEEFAFEQPGGDERHVVDVDRGRLVARGAGAQIADAADREARSGEVGLGVADVGQRLLERRRVDDLLALEEIGRASGRERVCQYVEISVVVVSLKKNHSTIYQ